MMFLLRFLDHHIFFAYNLMLFLWISLCSRCCLVRLAIQLIFSAIVPKKTIINYYYYLLKNLLRLIRNCLSYSFTKIKEHLNQLNKSFIYLCNYLI